MGEMAKTLIFFGAVLILCGGVLLLVNKIPGVGRLPGDFVYKKDNVTIVFPLMTCLLLSLILSLVFYFFGRK